LSFFIKIGTNYTLCMITKRLCKMIWIKYIQDREQLHCIYDYKLTMQIDLDRIHSRTCNFMAMYFKNGWHFIILYIRQLWCIFSQYTNDISLKRFSCSNDVPRNFLWHLHHVPYWCRDMPWAFNQDGIG
jgi:hypothetical protein